MNKAFWILRADEFTISEVNALLNTSKKPSTSSNPASHPLHTSSSEASIWKTKANSEIVGFSKNFPALQLLHRQPSISTLQSLITILVFDLKFVIHKPLISYQSSFFAAASDCLFFEVQTLNF